MIYFNIPEILGALRGPGRRCDEPPGDERGLGPDRRHELPEGRPDPRGRRRPAPHVLFIGGRQVGRVLRVRAHEPRPGQAHAARAHLPRGRPRCSLVRVRSGHR